MNRPTHPDSTTPKPLDVDWPERETAGKGAPPPDDGDNDASSYGQPVDPDQVQDEGIAESLGKAVSAPIRDAAEGTTGPAGKP